MKKKITTENRNDFHAVLDGQQRLTALYIGFRGSYAYKLYKHRWEDNETSLPSQQLYLNLTQHHPEEENKYWFDFKASWESESFSDVFIDDCDNKWFRIGAIEGIESLRKYTGVNGIELDEKALDLIEILHSCLNNPLINFYEIEDKNYEEAVNIFIRINSGGTHLTTSNIMFSMVIASWQKHDAKQEFFNLIQDISNYGFTITNDFILRSFLYLFHKEVRFDLTSFTNEFLLKMEEKWEDIRESIRELFILLEEYGFSQSTLTSNLATLPILYYIYHKGIHHDFSQKVSFKIERKIMQKWLLIMLVRKVFGGSTDNVLKQSRLAFTQNIDIQFIQNEIMEFPAKKLMEEIKRISDVGEDFIRELLETQKDHIQAFSILALLYPHLDYKNGDFHKDHIHPISVCNEKMIEYSKANSIRNLQLLDSRENESKNNKSLEQWVQSQNISAEFLKKQHIPNILSIDKFDEFISKREEILIEYLLKVLNLSDES